MKTFFLLAAVACLTSPCWAVKTERWELDAPADFMRGKLHHLILTSEGELLLGHRADSLGRFGKEIWSSTIGRNGTIYFGTGSPAEVYAVGNSRKATRIVQFEAVAVTALACDSAGHVYAGTISEGKIFRISPDGKCTEVCRLPSAYVWALAPDNNGALFAATGPDGKIYRIGPNARPEEWFAAEETNILCLTIDADGSLLAGGSDRGLLYRVTAKGKATALHQFAEEEVRAIVPLGGNCFVAVNRLKTRPPRQPSLPAPRPAAPEPTESTAIAVPPAAPPAAPTPAVPR
ncbi:MAG: hypothetical protein N3B01_08500, partial [Verrucomicrobiae bacterium]|nr:hypothetical protein [Verrucomicrobiae bacterium]